MDPTSDPPAPPPLVDVRPLARQTLDELAEHIESALQASRASSCLVSLDPAAQSALEAMCASVGEPGGLGGLLDRARVSVVAALDFADLEWTQAGPVVFVSRPRPGMARRVASQVRALAGRRFAGRMVLLQTPRRAFAFEQVLRDEGVWAHLRSSTWGLNHGFIVLARDVVSLEMDGVWREAKAEQDPTSLLCCARALADLQSLTGRIPRVRSKGTHSKDVLDALIRLLREQADEEEDAEGAEEEEAGGEAGALGEPEALHVANERGGPLDAAGARPRAGVLQGQPLVDTLVLLDREVDMVSPLLTPLTYHALLDEVFGVSSTLHVQLDARILASEEDQPASSLVAAPVADLALAPDSLFPAIADTHMGHVMEALNKRARQQQEITEQARRERDVDVMLKVVKLLPRIQAQKRELEVHISLARYLHGLLMDRRWHLRRLAERAAIEGDSRALLECAQDAAARGEPLVKVLRMLCLCSVLSGGLANLEGVRQELVHAYGYETVFTLDKLEKLGVLAPRLVHQQLRGGQKPGDVGPAFASWGSVRKALRLMDEDRGDPAYVFSGTAPVSVRLVQLCISPGWDAKVDLLRTLAGPTFCDVVQPGRASTLPSSTKSGRPVLLVFYVGGVSLAEIAGLRAVAAQPDCPFDICVATTKVFNGTSLMQSLVHTMDRAAA